MSKDAAKILVQPGELVWGADDLTTVFPHGGTSLGYTVDGVRLRVDARTREITPEESGAAPEEVIYLGARLVIECTLYQHDADTIKRAFANTTAGTESQVAEYPGSSVYPGYKLSGIAGTLLFSPTDLINNRVVLFRKAVPLFNPSDINFGVSQDSTLRVEFVAIPDGNITSGDSRYDTRTMAYGHREDITI